MKEFIRRHPWQLEIVPFVVLTVAFVVPALYWQELRAQVQPWHGHSADQTWIVWYVLRGITAVGLFACSIDSNNIWVRYERSKRFNWWAMWPPPGLAFIGWYMADQSFGVFWLALGVVSLLTQVLIERARQFTPKGGMAEPSQAVVVRPGEAFYYREELNKIPLALRGVIGMWVAAPLIWTTTTSSDDGIAVICMFAICSLFVVFVSRIVFAVSRERVTARAGFRRVSIPISRVRELSVYDYDPLSGQRKGMVTTYDRMSIYAPRPGPCLRIETADGKAYLLGVREPEAFGNLIRAAMENAYPSQS